MLPASKCRKRTGVILGFLIATVILYFYFPIGSWAGDYLIPGEIQPRKINLISGKSVILKTAWAVKRVSIASPEIASYLILSPREIYITGKAAGVTNLIMWDEMRVVGIYDLEVSYDVSRLKEQIYEILPQEEDIRVTASHGSITLSGRVSNASALSQALAVAKAFAPEGKLNNLLEVGGIHQVMLEVRVAEMQKSLLKRFGVNFNYLRGNEFGISTLGGLTGLGGLAATGGIPTLGVSSAVNALFRFNRHGTTWTGFIDALKTDGLVKILAEPTLIALSGQTANFLAGGEFPVPVPQGLGTVGIEYKKFGVGLSFTPTVLSEKRISMNVVPEVSELDFSTATQIGGYVVPGLSTRRASTVIELDDGQSFAIAGLLRDTVRDQLEKFPLLGDIPILGALFRSRSFQKSETELIIIATPHLVKPLDMAKQSLPTDFYIEPNDMDIYILGSMEGQAAQGAIRETGKLDGDFGHAMPK
jgi:pilus assembly protein CpaC